MERHRGFQLQFGCVRAGFDVSRCYVLMEGDDGGPTV